MIRGKKLKPLPKYKIKLEDTVDPCKMKIIESTDTTAYFKILLKVNYVFCNTFCDSVKKG